MPANADVLVEVETTTKVRVAVKADIERAVIEGAAKAAAKVIGDKAHEKWEETLKEWGIT